jgi:hypothetical protein
MHHVMLFSKVRQQQNCVFNYDYVGRLRKSRTGTLGASHSLLVWPQFAHTCTVVEFVLGEEEEIRQTGAGRDE